MFIWTITDAIQYGFLALVLFCALLVFGFYWGCIAVDKVRQIFSKIRGCS